MQGNECGECKNLIVLEVKNLKETLYFYEGILGITPSSERPQLDITGVWYDADSTRIGFVMNRMLEEERRVLRIHAMV